MSVRVQICYSVALSSKHESKEMICTRSDVAKKQERVEGSGTTWICTSLTTTLPALGGMDAAAVAGEESSYASAVAQSACLFPGTVLAS
jgi:hypothetical protein